MDALIRAFNEKGIRYLLIGGQAVRLEGMPRFSMDWDFYIPPRDIENFKRLNALLESEVEEPIVPLGTKGEHFVQTYQTRWGILQFHLGGPGLPEFDKVFITSVWHKTESGVSVRCLSGRDLLASKQKTNRPQDQNDIRFLEKKAECGLLGGPQS
ncbi:MAG: hypothetical protein A2498_06960 [Lentisphaerae bacterium RIFOXYC12_FULL_60_16]|nr:MAG: hypothetical protein A2498_06960 [Lentisphaerae bacterium RIFOXYC12_FULL_60_16]OGV68618.1 MAG: hypothetical protein A2269_03215 [Lentisphaerae bacterium RIFOXYA12_FULL_60_10]OGV85671.1 MAG: hypothetical protein A2340_16205 [Lentisphaerae bacterium RIFOXYB12_FULL_60_10]